MWNSAWRLTFVELRKGWIALAGTILFHAYCGFSLSLMVMPIHDTGDSAPSGALAAFLGIVTNFFVLAVTPNLGFTINRKSMSYWKTDVYSKRLAFMKAMPIPNKVVVRSKLLQMLILMTAMSVVFFGCYGVASALFGNVGISALEYLLIALAWIGYVMTMGSMYMYWKLGFHGRQYFKRNLTMVFVYALAGALLWMTMGQSIWMASIEGVKVYQAGLPLITIAIGAAAMFWSARRLEKRLEQRDFHG